MEQTTRAESSHTALFRICRPGWIAETYSTTRQVFTMQPIFHQCLHQLVTSLGIKKSFPDPSKMDSHSIKVQCPEIHTFQPAEVFAASFYALMSGFSVDVHLSKPAVDSADDNPVCTGRRDAQERPASAIVSSLQLWLSPRSQGTYD